MSAVVYSNEINVDSFLHEYNRKRFQVLKMRQSADAKENCSSKVTETWHFKRRPNSSKKALFIYALIQIAFRRQFFIVEA